MDEASGKKIKKVTRFEKYSEQGIMDINTMIVFDMLCGQVDRHEEKFRYITHVEGNTEVIDSVSMIDNDMSFGNISVEDLEKGRGVAMPFDAKVLETIPNEVLEKIKSLDINTVRLMLGDVLTEEEIKSLEKRLAFLKKEIKTIEDNRAKLADFIKEYENTQRNLTAAMNKLKKIAENAKDGRFDKVVYEYENVLEESRKAGEEKLKKLKKANPGLEN